MDAFRDDLDWSFKAVHPLKIVIAGAGIGGLAAAVGLKKAGHDVVMVEQSREIGEVGAGIQMAPNATRIMRRLGLLETMMQKADVLDKISIRRWEDNSQLGTAPVGVAVEERYHAPMCVIHRGDLQAILLQAVKDLNVPIRLGCKVVAADASFSARVQLASGEWLSGDVVICADGIKSAIRRQMAGHYGVKDEPCPTGDAAYRVLIPKEKLKNDQTALKMLSQNIAIRWMGSGGHIMAYPIRHNTLYNIVLIHPEKPSQAAEESWTSKGDKNEMLDTYRAWNDTFKGLLEFVPDGEIMEWTLNTHLPLPSWTVNKCVLLGDACHPMLPYVAQGAAQAIEDASVLTTALSLISSPSEIETALQVYELVRKDRAEKIQNSAASTGKALHLPDGEEQRRRDDAIRASMKDANERDPDMWVDRQWQDFMWGVDVMKECVEGWDALVAKVGEHALGPLRPETSEISSPQPEP
ncbi:salicylate hydroxylase [Diplocarpon rosae]|nr:salicylate hydroxylase [Diplocarpon rosae]